MAMHCTPVVGSVHGQKGCLVASLAQLPIDRELNSVMNQRSNRRIISINKERQTSLNLPDPVVTITEASIDILQVRYAE
jgi:hypothetical protein